MSSLELKIPPVALALIFAGAMWGASELTPSLAFQPPWHLAVAVVLAGVGIAFPLAGWVAFRRAETTVNPAKPDATSAMVTSGVYRVSRNPMYVGFLLVLAAWATFLAHALAFIFLPAFVAYMNRFQIFPEERALSGTFGDNYQAYVQKAPRWIW